MAKSCDLNWLDAIAKAEVGKTIQDLFHGDTQFHAGEMYAEANMSSATERKMALRFSMDVEDLGLLPSFRIAIGDSDHEIHKSSGRNSDAFDFRISNGRSTER